MRTALIIGNTIFLLGLLFWVFPEIADSSPSGEEVALLMFVTSLVAATLYYLMVNDTGESLISLYLRKKKLQLKKDIESLK